MTPLASTPSVAGPSHRWGRDFDPEVLGRLETRMWMAC